MKHILFDLFLVSLGAGIGVITMCLVQAGSQTYRILGDCLNRCRLGIQCRWRKRRTVTVIQ